MGERYYDPSRGRFTQLDPLGGGYPYTANSPVNFTDPSGYCGGGYEFEAGEEEGSAVTECEGGGGGGGPASGGSNVGAVGSGPSQNAVSIGPYAGASIPARGPGRDFTPDEREAINAIGYDTGCHTCGSTDPGTKSGNFVPDHQPPNQLYPDNGPQELYPQCLACSRQQGGQIRAGQFP